MRNLILLYILIWSIKSNALEIGGNGKFKEAGSNIQQAILSYDSVKDVKKKVEKYAYKYSPLSKKTTNTVISTALSATKGEVDTSIVKTNIKMLGGEFRPNIIYNFKNDNIRSSVNLNWSF